MIVNFKFPDKYVPEEREYIWYCAIKLYKGKYIDKEEAMIMMDIKDEKKFSNLYSIFEKRYKKIYGNGCSDGDFYDDE